MSKIIVDISSARAENTKLPAVRSRVESVQSGVSTLKGSVVSSVQEKGDIRARLNRAGNDIAAINAQLQRLYTGLNGYLDKYETLENSLVAIAGGNTGNAKSANAAQFDNPAQAKDSRKSLLNMLKNIISGGWAMIVGDHPTESAILKKLSTIINQISKADSGNGDTKYYSGLLKYMASYFDIINGKKTGAEAITSLFKFGGASETMWAAVGKWLEKSLSGTDLKAFSSKYGEEFAAASVIGSAMNLTSTYIKATTDYSGNLFDRISRYIDLGKDVVKLNGDLYSFMVYAPEIAKGSAMATQAAKNLSIYLKLVTGGFTTVSTAVKSYGKYSADGVFDLGDGSAMAIDASVAGLNDMFLFGLLDAEKASEGIKDFAAARGRDIREYINSHEYFAEMDRNASNEFQRYLIFKWAGDRMDQENAANFIATKLNDLKCWWNQIA